MPQRVPRLRPPVAPVLLMAGKTARMKMSGYDEFDFLGAAPTANEVESNSFNIRQRQL